MAELSRDQLDFLRMHKIPLSRLFDATGLKASEFDIAMKAQGKSFAYGVSPCKKSGHTLRTRKNHCIQCDTSRITFMLASDLEQHVYIAASVSGRYIKIGTTRDIRDRENKLNEDKYGSQTDWQILASAHCKYAGKIEGGCQQSLWPYRAVGTYQHAGKEQVCYELFHCDFQDARDALIGVLGSKDYLKIANEARAIAAFRFRR